MTVALLLIWGLSRSIDTEDFLLTSQVCARVPSYITKYYVVQSLLDLHQ
jgi:hypothetical protein